MKKTNKLKRYIKGRKIRRRNRSLGADILLTLILGIFGAFSALPLLNIVANAFKPMSEIFLFPPKLITVENPTLNNFFDLGNIIEGFDIPFSRYAFNTFFITGVGTAGTVLLGSMAAFPLAKYKFPGAKVMSEVIVYSLMFSGSVTQIPVYFIMSKLGLVNTYWAVILPAIGGTLGLYLMKNFMVQIPDEMTEAAKIDGATEMQLFFKVVMPLCKPAWITLIILSIQSLWGNTGGEFIYSEEIKPLSYVLSQITSSGIARSGVSSAVSLIMLIVPVTVFIVSQSNVIETMATSGMKG